MNTSTARLAAKASAQTRNRNVGVLDNGGAFAVQKQSESDQLSARGPRPAPDYVAPNVTALKTLVNANGKIQTWGSFLEEINAEGTHLGLSGHRSSKTSVLVRSRDGDTSFVIPAAVAKASGLPSVDTEKDLAQLRMNTTENALDNYEMRLPMHALITPSTDSKRQDLRAARDQAQWEYDRILNDEAAELYARDGQQIVADALSHFDETGRLPITNDRVLAYAALDDEDLALKLISLAERHDKTPFRTGMSSQMRVAFLDHDSEKVRTAAIENGFLPDSFGVMQGYIGRYPSQTTVKAANVFFAGAGHKGTFTLNGDTISYVDVEGRTNGSVKVASAAARYETRLRSPAEIQAAKSRR